MLLLYHISIVTQESSDVKLALPEQERDVGKLKVVNHAFVLHYQRVATLSHIHHIVLWKFAISKPLQINLQRISLDIWWLKAMNLAVDTVFTCICHKFSWDLNFSDLPGFFHSLQHL